MTQTFFIDNETLPQGSQLALERVLAELPFNRDGLLPVIVQDHSSKDVLMMAWTNLSGLRKTIDTGLMTYWSRSRQQEWIKGQSSGHRQKLVKLFLDCDGDTLLCQVEQTGPACHTGRQNCFYYSLGSEGKQFIINSKPISNHST